MAIFGFPEAKYFCSGYSAAPGPGGSFRAYLKSLTRGTVFTEGTGDFNALRDASLREVDRLLFLAASSYRRAFHYMLPSSANWAYVSLYYSSFYSAASLLGMYGNWTISSKNIIDVRASVPGRQQLEVTAYPSAGGSHKQFWDFFYQAVSPLLFRIPVSQQFAVKAISGDAYWLIDRRNDINYDSVIARDLMAAFQRNFRRTRLRSTLPGVLNTQFQVAEALLEISGTFARDLAVVTDGLEPLMPAGRRQRKARTLLLRDSPPPVDYALRKRLVVA